MKNLGDQLQVLNLLPVASVAASGNGTGVDLQQLCEEIAAVFDVSAATAGTLPTMDIKLQDSDDNSSFADIAGMAITQVTTVASVQKIVLNKDNVRRYLRAVKTLGGTSSPAFLVSGKVYGINKYVS